MGEFGNNLDVFNNIICYLESFNGEFPIKYFRGIKKKCVQSFNRDFSIKWFMRN